MNITFICNCQTLSLCFFFQELMSNNNDNYICWIPYSEDFLIHLSSWSDKCKNKILNYDDQISKIKDSDVIIYQNVVEEKSNFCRTEFLNESKKINCKLIQIPSIYFIYNEFDNSMKNLVEREENNKVTIKASDIFKKYRDYDLMLSKRHPKTYFFMVLGGEISKLLGIEFFKEDKLKHYLSNANYMELPNEI